MKKNIALTGGGTGGHIFPLISIYNYLKKDEEIKCFYFGDEEGLEAEIAQNYDIPFSHIPCGKFRRYFDIKNFFEPLKNISGFFWGIYFLLRYNIDIVISKGGYVGLPLTLAGIVLRKKVYIHESDTESGISNKILSKFATKVFYTFPNEKIDGEKHILLGQIINNELVSSIDTVGEIVENEHLEVLVIAGSQGSRFIFEQIKTVLNNLIDVHFTIILGEKNLSFRSEFEKFSNVEIHGFVSQAELGALYKKTDIAISRAGATTLWELYFFGIHTIIIPLEGSAQNHQYHNAKYFQENFGSDVLQQDSNLNLEIFRKLNKYKDLRKHSLNTKDMFHPLETLKKEIGL